MYINSQTISKMLAANQSLMKDSHDDDDDDDCDGSGGGDREVESE